MNRARKTPQIFIPGLIGTFFSFASSKLIQYWPPYQEFRDEFSDFDPEARSVIEEVDQLTPPPEAESVHQTLTGGLDQCDQGLDLMDDWFETPDDDIRDAATLLILACVEDVSQAADELSALTGEDISIEP